MIYHDFEIAELIARHITGQATPEQSRALEEWRGRSAANEALYERLTAGENMRGLDAMAKKYDRAEGWENVRGRIGAPVRKIGRRLWIAAVSAAAAVVVAIVAIPVLTEMTGGREQAESIRPGGFGARLILPDGTVVELDQNNEEAMGRNGIVVADKTINYDPDALGAIGADYFHTLETPHGGECRVVLGDGTTVWLNSMTTMRYPARFADDVRRVELSGEAYFEVAHGEIPFVVSTAEMDVRVHGTSFNVSAYGDSPRVEAVLVSGSVSVSTAAGSEVVLEPSEMARLEKAENSLIVMEVDPELYTSWKDGLLKFRDCRLEEIMQILGRWYDIEEVVYEREEIRGLRFGLNLDRYDTIDPILELLNRTGGVRVKADGKKIVFTAE